MTAARAATRKSLPLTERDHEELDRLRESAAHRAALSRLVRTDLTETISEARLLHAVLEAGILAVREQVEEEGYAQMAAGTDAAARQASARRRHPTWGEE